jgi:hypothetical protein
VDKEPPRKDLKGDFALCERLALFTLSASNTRNSGDLDMAGTRGRPAKTQSFEFCQDLWVRIEYLRFHLAKPNGRLASVRRVAMELAKNGGVAEIIGGDKEFLAREVADFLPDTRLAYASVESVKGRIAVPIFASYVTSDWKRIRNLYYEADKWTADPAIEFAWRNMVRDLCGQPRNVRDLAIRTHLKETRKALKLHLF